MSEEFELGMQVPIQRRDFLQGMVLSAGALALACASPSKRPSEGIYSSCSGFGGQSDSARNLGHSVRWNGNLKDVCDTGEEYDLVVVGAGISGLAAAMVYKKLSKHKAKILLLDNRSEFGGHATRNTFFHAGQKYIVHGGAFTLEGLEESPHEALTILEEVGISVHELPKFRKEEAYSKLRLSPCLLFDSHQNRSRPHWHRNFHNTDYTKFFSSAPLKDCEKRELIDFYTNEGNCLETVADKTEYLKTISWESYIRNHRKLGDLSVRFANMYSTDLFGLGCDTVAASHGWKVGPGFLGLGGKGFVKENGLVRYTYDTRYRFPDGNHTIARALLRYLIPKVFGYAKTMEELFEAEVDSSEFESSQTKLRLNSMASEIRHNSEGGVDVIYRNSVHSLHRVRAKSAIMSGWGMVAKYIVPELSITQKEALNSYQYASAIYINVFLRNWKAIAEIGAKEMYTPDGYCTWMSLLDPLELGNYKPRYSPECPTVLTLFKYLYKPGMDKRSQLVLGRAELEGKPYSVFEREIRGELNRLFGPWGFDARRDILGIQVNRWAHGYNFFNEPNDSGTATYVGRQALGKISFCGADAGAEAWMQAGLQQAWRAAEEQVRYF